MNLCQILKPESIKVPLDATDKQHAIEEMVDLLGASHEINGIDVLKEAVWSREQARTTGIGQGLAIPHGKSEACQDLMLAIGKPAEPIDFDSIDSQPVKLIVLLVSPPDQTSQHIQALARISRLMTQDDFRESIYCAQSAEVIYRLIEEYESSAAGA